MRTLFRAAFAALSVASVSPALAGEGEGTVANTQFTLEGGVAQRPVARASLTVAQDRDSANAFATQSNHIVSLFPPHDGNDGGGN